MERREWGIRPRMGAVLRGFAAAGVAALLLAAPVHAQIGAIGAGATRAVRGENLYERAPVFLFSALVFPQRQWSLGTYASASAIDDPAGTAEAGALGIVGFYGLARQLTVGAGVNAVATFTARPTDSCPDCREIDESGVGDASLFAVYQLWRSPQGRTKAAVIGRVTAPLGDDEIDMGGGRASRVLGYNGVYSDVGLTMTHNMRRLTLNAGASVGVPSDDRDQGFVQAGGAVVLPVGTSTDVSLEGLWTDFETGYVLRVGPGLRVRAGRRLVLDAGVLVQAATSIDGIDNFALAALGLTFVP